MNSQQRKMQQRQAEARRIAVGVLAFLIFLQAAAFTIVCREKDGFHEDEGFTLSINGDEAWAEFSNYTNRWVDPLYFDTYFAVPEEGRFHYDGVLAEALLDPTNPPLYYFAFHTVYSFFPGLVSAWPGILLNLLFFVLAQVCLWNLGLLLFRHPMLALLPPVFFGFSLGALNAVSFLRMYMLAMLIAAAFLLLAFRLLRLGFRVRETVLLAAVGFLGAMTHYYLIFYLILVTAAYFTSMILRCARSVNRLHWGCWLPSIISAAAFVAAIVGAFFAHPVIWAHITSTADGLKTAAASRAGGSGGQFAAFMQAVASDELNISAGLPKIIVLLGLLVFAIALLVGMRTERGKKYQSRLPKIALREPVLLTLLATTAVYFAVVFRTAPYQVDRFLMPCFPAIALLLSFAMAFFAQKLRIDARAVPTAIALLLAVFSLGGYTDAMHYLYPQKGAGEALRLGTASEPVVVLAYTGAGRECLSLFPELYLRKQGSPLYIADYPELEQNPEELAWVFESAREQGGGDSGRVTVFVASMHQGQFQPEAAAEAARSAGGFGTSKYLYSIPNYDVYELS
ncbi:MAG: DUF4231 domain-containing protein [Clostridiales Family XIII bacterium]|jgi:hypothetical protein|nr:DUF4231 domain-containing protein [Clostridiales Family XIII bacterium]